MDHLSCHFWSTLACFHPKGKLKGRHQTLYKNNKTQKKGEKTLYKIKLMVALLQKWDVIY
jgi:hypothetical protein